MRVFIVLFAVTLAVQAVPTLLRNDEFNDFKLTHGKHYTSSQEESFRLKVFSENLREIEEHNQRYEQGLETYTLGVNEFADMTDEEFNELLNYQGSSSEDDSTKFVEASDFEYGPAASVDWRAKGAVTPAKRQGGCGSCWSFSATGAVEGAIFIKTGKLVPLSQQNLVDCDTYDFGCKGGRMQSAFRYIKEHGITYDKNYPYVGINGTCKLKSGPVKISGYQNVAHNENALATAVSNVGPVSIAVDARYFKFYKGGVFNYAACSSTKLNHGVLAVGYGNDGKNNYWLVKNSWGPTWGEKGYIRIIKDSNNHCGVATNPSYPIA